MLLTIVSILVILPQAKTFILLFTKQNILLTIKSLERNARLSPYFLKIKMF